MDIATNNSNSMTADWSKGLLACFIMQVSNRCLCRHQYLIENEPAPFNSMSNALLITRYSLLHTTAIIGGAAAIELCAGSTLKSILGDFKYTAVPVLAAILHAKLVSPILQKFEFTKEEEIINTKLSLKLNALLSPR